MRKRIVHMEIFRVGGAVRDKILNYPSHENDWVVTGSTPEEMIGLGYRPVGRDFPVFIEPKTGDEYALARTERKTGVGYAGFTFFTDPSISLEDDLVRRDLTINAIAEDKKGNLIDPFGGLQDIELRVLRHVSDAFSEDPLRVLRIARFASRYAFLGFKIAPETMTLMADIVQSGDIQNLVAERIWRETERALCEKSPDVFIKVLRDCGALQLILPEVDALFGIPQRADFHPEIDTGIHILMVLEQVAKLTKKSSIRFSALVHDLGKAITPKDILPRHTGHELRGVPLVQAMCDRLKVPNEHRSLAMVVTEFHLLCHKCLDLKPETLLNLLKSIGALQSAEKLDDFLTCCTADIKGRKGLEGRDYPSSAYMLQAYEALNTMSVTDIVTKELSGAAIGEEIMKRQIHTLTHFKSNYMSQLLENANETK